MIRQYLSNTYQNRKKKFGNEQGLTELFGPDDTAAGR